MKIKRLLSIILIVFVFFSLALFTGCSGENSEDDVPSITWYVPCDSQKFLSDVLVEANKILVEKVGAKLELKLIDNGSYAEKMNMVIASNEAYDICFTSSWLNNFSTNVNKGAFKAIDEYLDSVPELKSVVSEDIMKVGMVEGKTYAIPIQQVFPYQRAAFVDKKYIDEFNFDYSDVQKVEDLEPLMEMIHNKYPDIYTLRTRDVGVSLFLYRDLEYIDTNTNTCIKKTDDKVTVYPIHETDEWKYSAAKMAEYFKKGYIRKDIDSVMDDSTDFKAGKYAIYFKQYKPGVEAEEFAAYGREVVCIPIEEPYTRYNTGITAMSAISRNCKNPELALKVLQEVNTNQELYNLLVFGIEGVNYEKYGTEGQIKKNEKNNYGLQAWTIGNQFLAYPLDNQSPTVWDETRAFNESAAESPIMGFLWNSENVKTEITNISTANKQHSNFYLFATGNEFNKAYQEYCDAMDTAGQQTIVNEVQRQIDEYLSRKLQ